ncbi:MAG: glucosamine--fructose-6-phosphate aminotransferase (isomerizing), partial [Planctomycetota bacterium]
MCGIVGTIRQAGTVTDGLIRGLRLLEYRGYDSSGLALVRNGAVEITKRAGRLNELEKALSGADTTGAEAGIGHTRWATHGAPTDLNAHPHGATRPDMALVHNGIFDNYAELKAGLEAEGVQFASDTDTEVMAFLIERERSRGKSLEEALRSSLALIDGYYALAVVTIGANGTELICARQGPPLALAVEGDAAHLASDPLGLLEYTDEIIFLEDGDIATLTPGAVKITNALGLVVDRMPIHIEWDAEETGKGEFRHYMLKEIHEQPAAIARTVAEYLDDEAGDVNFGSRADGTPFFSDEALAGVQRIQVLACGTALHAGLVGRYMIEGLAGLPVDVEYASEFRYRDLHLVPGTMVLAISQSGETADTLAATRRARELGCSIAVICNVDGSTQVREADHVILTKAGPEIGVASTKAFTAQVAAAFLLSIRIGRAKGAIDKERGLELLTELR